MEYRLVNIYTEKTSFHFLNEIKLIQFLKKNRLNEAIEGEFNLDDYRVEYFDAKNWEWREVKEA